MPISLNVERSDHPPPGSEIASDRKTPAPGLMRLAVGGLFVLAVLYTLYFAKPVLLPIALALLFAWVLRPLVRGLQGLKVPESLAAALVVGGVLCAVGSGAYLLTEPAMKWAENAPQTLREIETEIQRLPLRQREAFMMRYWEELDVTETAHAMGCSEGSVKTHCSRAVQALARALRARGITL